MGIRDEPTAPASPWQNGFAERLIGSIRRECVDHIIVLGEVHLRQSLQSYARYYNDIRTHRSLDKDAPVSRQIQRIGASNHTPSLADFTTTTPELKFSVHTTCNRYRSRDMWRQDLSPPRTPCVHRCVLLRETKVAARAVLPENTATKSQRIG